MKDCDHDNLTKRNCLEDQLWWILQHNHIHVFFARKVRANVVSLIVNGITRVTVSLC